MKCLNGRERAGACRALQSWCREPNVQRPGGRGAAKQEGALAELGTMNDVKHLFAASSITPYFSLEL